MPSNESPATDGGVSETDAGAEETSAEDSRIGRGLLDRDMGPGSSLAHLYRGEIHRTSLWRERLDRTTNWAVIVIATVLTWTFSSATNPHYLLLVAGAVVGTFLGIEALRYRAYGVWRSRVRRLQNQVWALGLDPANEVDGDWRGKLARTYRSPRLRIPTEEAVAHRLRRVYFPLFTILAAAWVLRVVVFANSPWPASAAIGGLPGPVVTAIVTAIYVGAFVVCCRPRTWHTRGELLDERLRDP